MDLSDGLAKDLGRMCAASGCGAQVRFTDVPLSPAAAKALAADPAGGRRSVPRCCRYRRRGRGPDRRHRRRR
jgi:hypothetical protein